MRPPPHAATSAPRNGGNGVIRGVTRRRHAGSQFLMLQNPHRSEPRASRRLQDLGAGPIGAEKTRPTRHLQRHFHEKTRPACQKTPILRCFERAGRTISRTRRDNVATLKPTTPLLAPNKGPVKPASPLQPEDAPKTPISHPQRRWRFQPHTDTHEQRRQGFQTTGPPRLQGPAAPPTLTKPGHAWVVPCLHGCQTTHRVPLRQRRP